MENLLKVLKVTLCIFLALTFTLGNESFCQIKDISPSPPMKKITSGQGYYFIGGNGIRPWSASGRYLLFLESVFQNREPSPGDQAQIRMVDLQTGFIIPIGETAAWNFQQGCMFHWLPASRDTLIAYNDRIGRRFISVIHNIYTDEKRELPLPIGALSQNGQFAISMDYRRLHEMQPGYGYDSGRWAGPIVSLFPDDDGIFIMNVKDGSYKLIVSYAKAYDLMSKTADTYNEFMWFPHMRFNTDDSKIFFLARIGGRKAKWYSAGFTVNLDGSDLRCVLPTEWNMSFFDWMSPSEILAITQPQGKRGYSYVLFTDGKQDYRVTGQTIVEQIAHGNLSPDRQWMVSEARTDKKNTQMLLLTNLASETVFRLGEFNTIPKLKGPLECNLNPHWNHDGTSICFDSVHEGTRHVYIMDVAEVVKKKLQ